MGGRRLWGFCACVLLVCSGNTTGAGEWEMSGDGPNTTPVATTVTNDWEISGDDSPTTTMATTTTPVATTPTNDWEISGDDSPTTTVATTTTPVATTPTNDWEISGDDSPTTTSPVATTMTTPVATTTTTIPVATTTTIPVATTTTIPVATTPTNDWEISGDDSPTTTSPVATTTTPVATMPTPVPTIPPTPPKITSAAPPVSSPTTAMNPCSNGGTWAEGRCQCPENFQGDRCQNAKDIVEIKNATVDASVEMRTRVDAEFTDKLNDQSSEEFRNFTREFQRTMSRIYRGIPGYRGVEVRKLSKGSIVVEFDVLLVVSASTVANETVRNISKSLVSAVHNYTACDTNCAGANCSLCFVPNSTSVQNVTVQEVEADVCHSHIQENFRDFYMPYLTAAGVVCITRCDARHAEPWPCGYGSCSVGERGPSCQCSDEASFWYQDRFCRSRVSKVAVTASVSVAILVLVTTVFTALLLLNRRRQKKQERNRMRSRSELYDSDDGDWDRPHGFAMQNMAATWEDMETPSTSYINLERVDTSRTIHIRRPTAVR